MTISVTSFPDAGALSVVPDTRIFLSYSITGGSFFVLSATRIHVDGALVFNEGVFVRPDWYGSYSPKPFGTPTQFSLEIRSRRLFLYGVKVHVEATIGTSVDSESIAPVDMPARSFFIRSAPAVVGSSSFRQTPADVSIESPALRALQQVLQQGMSAAETTSFLLVLVRRVLDSPLRSYMRSSPPEVLSEVTQLRSVDVVSTMQVVEVLGLVSAVWEAALQELQAAGISPNDLEVIDRVWLTGNPINRVAAACLAVLLRIQVP